MDITKQGQGQDASPEAADAEAVLAKIKARFGPGISNGVAALLGHPELPERFSKESWNNWMFRPSDAAFDIAHDWGLITPWKLSSKWTFTPLGAAAGALLRLARRHRRPLIEDQGARVCRICDGGAANECACTCGFESWDGPAALPSSEGC